jgi:hypothetical protein
MSRVLALSTDGRSVAYPLRHVSGALAVLTRLQVRLQTIRGTWPDDVAFGLPWDVWREAPATPLIQIEGRVRAQARQEPGVERVTDVTVSRDSDGILHISVRAEVRDSDGTTVEAQLGAVSADGLPAVWMRLMTQGIGVIG